MHTDAYGGISDRVLYINAVALAIDPFLSPCYGSLLGVVCDVISDAVAEEEEAIGWMFPFSGCERAQLRLRLHPRLRLRSQPDNQ